MQLQVQVGRCQSQPTDAAPCSYGCCWWHSAGTRDHECQRHSASGSAVAAAWTAAQSKAAARQPRSDSTAYIDTPAPAFKSAAPTPQARLLASSRCLLVAASWRRGGRERQRGRQEQMRRDWSRHWQAGAFVCGGKRFSGGRSISSTSSSHVILDKLPAAKILQCALLARRRRCRLRRARGRGK